MASSTLIGTAPDQVPTNGDLGDLAFQNKESIEFYDGRGGLSQLDITAISRQISVSAVDVFIYDTSKDSDGGAWRKRCQHTSWYNETLNTATRGARREFPAVAVIVAESNKITIYDGDDPDLPMWMVFIPSISSMWQLPSLLCASNTVVTSISAINGIISTGSSPYGLRTLGFVDESSIFRELGYYRKILRPISDRNANSSYEPLPDLGSSGWLVNDTVNDVAMTVLPNAPIDAATGLPIPTIAVATNGGVSVIKDDGSVKNITHGNADYSCSYDVAFTKKNQLRVSMDSTSRRFFRTYNIPNSNISVDQWVPSADDGVTAYINYANGDIAHGGNISATTSNAIGTIASGLTVFEETLVGSTALHATITSKSNTGWMVGNGSKGAWLSDTTQETVVGAELITNGTFVSNTSGWSVSGGTISVVSGAMRLNDTSGSFAYATTSFTTVPGKQYTISISVTNSASSQNYIRMGTYANSYEYLGSNSIGSGTGTWVYTFTAASNTTYLTLISGTSTYADWDNISCRLSDPDRSVNNKGLQVFGNITKTPVAAGAELVAYSGFSASNYLEQPYNSALGFGAGSFCVMGWLKENPNSTYEVVWSLGDPVLNASRYVMVIRHDGLIYFSQINSTPTEYALNGPIIDDGIWHHIAFVRTTSLSQLFIDGKLSATSTDVINITNASAVMKLGVDYNYTVPLTNGSLALWRVSATAPTAEQIAKMYNDEKVLFQDNAKATLYGTSDAVTALAYDEDTNLLHVGTSSGRSVFQGLRRVDNTTTAVSAAISAANGLVAEN